MTTKTDTFNYIESPLSTLWTTVLSVGLKSAVVGANATSGSVQVVSMYKIADYDFLDDQSARIVIGTIVAFDWAGVVVRASTAGGGSFYLCYYASGDARVIIEYWTGGAFSATLETITGAPGTLANGDELRLDVTGTSLRAYKNGAAIGTGVTHSSLTSGQPGMGYLAGNANTTLISSFSGVDSAGGDTLNAQCAL